MRSNPTFAPGDRVVAINIDMTGSVCSPGDGIVRPYFFPDGHLRNDVIYHVDRFVISDNGQPGVFLTGLRVFRGGEEIPWHSSRFRKVDTLLGHVPKKRRRKQPFGAVCDQG